VKIIATLGVRESIGRIVLVERRWVLDGVAEEEGLQRAVGDRDHVANGVERVAQILERRRVRSACRG
jgi:hypothetical protein